MPLLHAPSLPLSLPFSHARSLARSLAPPLPAPIPPSLPLYSSTMCCCTCNDGLVQAIMVIPIPFLLPLPSPALPCSLSPPVSLSPHMTCDVCKWCVHQRHLHPFIKAHHLSMCAPKCLSICACHCQLSLSRCAPSHTLSLGGR